MDAHVQRVMEDSTAASDEGRIAFGEVVRNLAAIGVERYHADLLRHEKTYYLPNGESHCVPSATGQAETAIAFSAAGVEAAIRDSQAGRIRYRSFCERIAEAGCVGYIVSLAGQRAVYFGRTGECHVEPFPQR